MCVKIENKKRHVSNWTMCQIPKNTAASKKFTLRLEIDRNHMRCKALFVQRGQFLPFVLQFVIFAHRFAAECVQFTIEHKQFRTGFARKWIHLQTQ